jgi:hypothetical protein
MLFLTLFSMMCGRRRLDAIAMNAHDGEGENNRLRRTLAEAVRPSISIFSGILRREHSFFLLLFVSILSSINNLPSRSPHVAHLGKGKSDCFSLLDARSEEIGETHQI